jgi:hypothetical protein
MDPGTPRQMEETLTANHVANWCTDDEAWFRQTSQLRNKLGCELCPTTIIITNP